jgi:hypothetical protein
MQMLRRLARSPTAAAAAAAVLALLLAIGAFGAFPAQYGIDFYQFWGVPLARASGNLPATPYVDMLAYARVLNAIADASPSEKLRNANRYRRGLEPMATPFLYSTFAALPPDYERAQAIFTAMLYAAAWLGAFILARLSRAPPWPAACIAFFVLYTFNPFAQDVRVGNVNSLQLLLIATLIGISALNRFSGNPWRDGLWLAALALMVAFKPNTPWIAAALGIHYFVARGSRAFAIGAIEAALCAIAAFAIGAWFMGGPSAWIEWFDLARGMDGSGMALPYERGNLSVAMLLGRASPALGVKGGALVLAAALAIAIMAVLSGRTTSIATAARRAFADPGFAASVGIVFTFATSPLVWPHYHLLLLVPIAWLVARRESCRACVWCAVGCYLVLSRGFTEPLVSMRMFDLLQAATLISWVALLPGLLAHARISATGTSARSSTPPGQRTSA